MLHVKYSHEVSCNCRLNRCYLLAKLAQGIDVLPWLSGKERMRDRSPLMACIALSDMHVVLIIVLAEFSTLVQSLEIKTPMA